jgi:hypothetical protein
MNPYQANPFDEPSKEYNMPDELNSSRWFMRGLVAACGMNMFMEYMGRDITFGTQAFTGMTIIVCLMLTDGFNFLKLLKG